MQNNLDYADEHLELRIDNGMARLDGRELVLTNKEFALLATLVANEGEVVFRNDLLSDIWGYSESIRTRTLDVHMRRLRLKLGGYGDRCLETIFGSGYRFNRFRPVHSFRGYAQVVTAA